MENEYVLGTHDEEVARLGIQHAVWRRRALDAWLDAGFTSGQTLLDLGAGPGYATLDLAEIAGPAGEVVAIDKSRRFLDVLSATAGQRGLNTIRAVEADFDAQPLPDLAVDGAWARWVFAFVAHPRELLRKARAAIKSGGVLVIHEYFDYSTWKLSPRSEVFESFVTAVMKSWRANGGEADIGLDLLRWLPEEGFRVRRVRPIIEVISPRHFMWQWPHSFIATGVDRLLELGYLSAEQADSIKDVFARSESDADTLMVTPGVVELIADAV